MFLLYLDESGPLSNPESSHVVVAGVGVHETLARRLIREIDSVFARHLDEHLRKLELHAQQIRQGSGRWHGIPREVRSNLLRDLCAMTSDFHLTHPTEFATFAICREPGAIPGAEPLDRIFEEVLMKFQGMIRKGPARHEMGIVICDKAKHEAVIQPRVGAWLADGTRLGKLSRIVDVPLFVDSTASRLIQLADLVAHAVWRAYEKSDADMLDLLLPAFIRGQGDRLDSFSHLSGRHSECECYPCLSRRPRGLPELPPTEEPGRFLQDQLFPT